jgi:type I restriction enzyme S subunit
VNSGWISAEWGDVATLQYGKGLRGYEASGKPYRVYGTNGPIGTHDVALSSGPTVVVGRKGAYRGIHFSSAPCYVIDTAFYLTPRVDLDMRWAYYALLTHDINGMDSGSAIPSTSREAFYRLPVLLPPLREQSAISSMLGALDDKIELNQKTSATLDAMARALFKSWFVDFDPVRARAEGRDTGLPAEIDVLFPDSFNDSELGEIPRGWTVEPVGSIANANRSAINPANYSDEPFYHYSLPAFDVGRLPVFEMGAQIKSNKFLIPEDAVLISRLNPKTPRIWMPQVDDEYRSICSTEFAVMVPRAISREWLYSLFCSSDFCGRLATMVTGTSGSHQRVKPESLDRMQVVFPPQPIADQFTNISRPLVSRAVHALQESKTLATLRDALLPKLISGEIRVADAERIVAKSA